MCWVICCVNVARITIFLRRVRYEFYTSAKKLKISCAAFSFLSNTRQFLVRNQITVFQDKFALIYEHSDKF